MIKNIMMTNLNMGSFLSGIVFYFLKNTILKQTKFDVLGKNQPIEKVNLVMYPCCLLIGDSD
jgi:hypothetical protein